MDRTTTLGTAVVFGIVAGLLPAGAARAEESPSKGAPSVAALVAEVVRDGPERARPAVEGLRARGPEGLDALLEAYRRLDPEAAEAAPLREAIDAVAAQRFAHASGLFWHTDLESARAEAARTGRPILSLRLLGRLDEDCSCANSRFFRTVLYANADVSRVLRETFVLHWRSVRPVPKVTIDFGDGRRIERTITGNSAHYVLDPEGRVVDVVPGLYGPAAFLRALEGASSLVRASAEARAPDRDARVAAHHARRLEAMRAAWDRDVAGSGAPALPLERAPDAEAGVWTHVAGLHAEDARLDPSSVALMRSRFPDAVDAGRVAVSKAMIEDPILRAVRMFQRSLAEDTVRNEYLLRRRVHEWFATGTAGSEVEALNARVYAELFLSPLDDPWLGLAPSDAYAAIEGEGLLR